MLNFDDHINILASQLKSERKAYLRKRKELASKIYIQKELFPGPARRKTFSFPVLFEVKNDVSESNMKRIFTPLRGRISHIEAEIKHLSLLKNKAIEAEKLQLSIF